MGAASHLNDCAMKRKRHRHNGGSFSRLTQDQIGLRETALVVLTYSNTTLPPTRSRTEGGDARASLRAAIASIQVSRAASQKGVSRTVDPRHGMLLV